MIDERATGERLRRELELHRYEAPQGQLEQVIQRAGRLRFRRVAVAAAVGGLMILGVAGPLVVLSSIRGPSTRPAGTGPVDPRVVADVAVGDFPSAITTGDGSIWVAVESRSADQNVVARIDPATNEVTKAIPVDGPPRSLAIGDGSLWIALDHSVQRVDPETGRVIAEIRGPGSFLTFTPGAVWAVDSANSMARIDSTTGEVVAAVLLGLPPSGYITGPPVGTRDARIDLEASTAFAVGDDAVWAVATYGPDRTHLTRIDAGTNEASSPVVVKGGWTPFAVGAGRLWLMGGREPEIRLAWLDLATLELEGSIVVGELPAFEGSGIFDPETDTVWVAQYEGSVTRVDLRQTPSPTASVTRCVQAKTSGDFDSDGTTDNAEFVEVVFGSVSCDGGGDVLAHLSSQELVIRFGSGQTLEQPFKDCQGGLCAYVFAAADLDGDGRDELAIDVGPGAAVDFVGFYRVDPNGIRPLVIPEPGDPPYVEPGPAILGDGFDSGLQSPIACKMDDDGTRELISIHAENVGESITGPWHVHTTAMALHDDRLVVTSTRDSRSSFSVTSGLFESECSSVEGPGIGG